MITIPKPKYIQRKKPAEQSEEDFKNEIHWRQSHSLTDAIERVMLG